MKNIVQSLILLQIYNTQKKLIWTLTFADSIWLLYRWRINHWENSALLRLKSTSGFEDCWNYPYRTHQQFWEVTHCGGISEPLSLEENEGVGWSSVFGSLILFAYAPAQVWILRTTSCNQGAELVSPVSRRQATATSNRKKFLEAVVSQNQVLGMTLCFMECPWQLIFSLEAEFFGNLSDNRSFLDTY